MTCQEAIGVLAEFLDATLDAGAARRMESHLADCDECRAYLATYRRTVGAVTASARAQMPDELRRRLRTFLIERLRAPD
jgi:anti-sigma factor RsiW